MFMFSQIAKNEPEQELPSLHTMVGADPSQLTCWGLLAPLWACLILGLLPNVPSNNVSEQAACLMCYDFTYIPTYQDTEYDFYWNSQVGSVWLITHDLFHFQSDFRLFFKAVKVKQYMYNKPTSPHELYPKHFDIMTFRKTKDYNTICDFPVQ